MNLASRPLVSGIKTKIMKKKGTIYPVLLLESISLVSEKFPEN